MLLLAQRARASVGSTSQAAPNSGASMQPSVHSLARGIAGSLSRLDPWVLARSRGRLRRSRSGSSPPPTSWSRLPLLRRTYWAIGHLSPAPNSWPKAFSSISSQFSLSRSTRGPRPHPRSRSAHNDYSRTRERAPARTSRPRARDPSAIGRRMRRDPRLLICRDTGWYYQQLPAITLFAAALTLELLPMAQPSCGVTAPPWLPTGSRPAEHPGHDAHRVRTAR